MGPVCFVCKVEMRCMENGVTWISLDRLGVTDEQRMSDLWGCTRCEAKVLVGHGAPTQHLDSSVKTFIKKGP